MGSFCFQIGVVFLAEHAYASPAAIWKQ